jgi:hypothetical protein
MTIKKKALLALVDKYAEAKVGASRAFDDGRTAFETATKVSDAAREAVVNALEDFQEFSYDFSDR